MCGGTTKGEKLFQFSLIDLSSSASPSSVSSRLRHAKVSAIATIGTSSSAAASTEVLSNPCTGIIAATEVSVALRIIISCERSSRFSVPARFMIRRRRFCDVYNALEIAASRAVAPNLRRLSSWILFVMTLALGMSGASWSVLLTRSIPSLEAAPEALLAPAAGGDLSLALRTGDCCCAVV
mgnify:CR=1 FL=1